MKKVFLPVFSVLLLASCSKSPVGPSMSSFAPSAAATSISATCTTTGNDSGATTVSTSQTSTVSTQSGETSVSSANASTGVSSRVSGTGGATGGSGSTGNGGTATETITYTIYDPMAADHTWQYISSAPRIAWDASVVNHSYQKVRVIVAKLIPSETFWDIKNLSRSSGSVVFGSTPAGSVVVTPAETLTPGNYYVSIIFYDNETDYNSLGGGGNFTFR